jgi:hypothetical protein
MKRTPIVIEITDMEHVHFRTFNCAGTFCQGCGLTIKIVVVNDTALNRDVSCSCWLTLF